jgi:DNA ligase (NAD+)
LTAIAKLDGFGKKSIDNLQTAIENSKTQPLHRFNLWPGYTLCR